ncbi:MAG: ComEA family DNA-binding protein [Haliea sp.]|uniref:ComEA family DNA-binding protein n=1 Tax=Haliea sp. TaxID=1932666 RepID=UPI0032EDAF62
MTYLEKSPQAVAGAGLAGRPLKLRCCAPLLAVVLGLGLAPGPVLAEIATEPPVVAAAGEARTVNINTADAASLAAGLQGVGLSRAEDIIRYRETYGPFGAVEELADVKGIGQATLDKNRAVITLE